MLFIYLIYLDIDLLGLSTHDITIGILCNSL